MARLIPFFLTLLRRRRLDSVARHRRWQASLDRDRFFDEVFGADAPAESETLLRRLW